MSEPKGYAAQKARDAVDGRRVVVSLSGGKDSTSVALHLREMGIPFDLVFMDTGWEHDVTYEYLRGDLTRALGPITWLRPARQMEELVKHKGMFPSRVRRFCTEKLKVGIMADYLKARTAAGERLVNAIGVRHEESKARASALEWETSATFGCDVWSPLIHWTLDDVIAIHYRHGLSPNPLYLRGASRVGCWPCIFARKSELRLIAEIDPARIDRIRTLEAEVSVRARTRYERDRAKWATSPDLEPEAGTPKHERWLQKRDRLAKPFSPPAFFQSQTKNAEGYPMLPIDEVVAWSRTAHGGKQTELFAPTKADTGCVRWGLCETGPTEPSR